MAKKRHSKGHGSGIKDPQTYRELMELPTRESLAPGKKGPTSFYQARPNYLNGNPWGYYSYALAGDSVDDRTVTEKAAQDEWDKRYAEIMAGDAERRKARERAAVQRERELARNNRSALAPTENREEPNKNQKEPNKNQEEPNKNQEESETNASPATLKNGAPKTMEDRPPKTTMAGTDNVPLRPRADITTDSRWGKTGPSDTGVRANGAPVEASDTATRGQIKSAQRDAAATDAIEAAETRRGAQNRAKTGERRRYQQYLADRDELDAAMEARRERKAAEREAKEQARRDKRFNNRTLVNNDDWENLGRSGSDKVDYSDAKNADAKKAHDDRVAELRNRLAKLSDRTLVGKDETATWQDGKFVKEGETTKWEPGKMVVTNKQGKIVDTSKREANIAAYGDDGMRYASDVINYDPDRRRELAVLRKLVEKGAEAGTITDAQLDGATKTLKGWESAALARRDAQAERDEFRRTERIRGLRKQYGMEDRKIYDDPAVEAYHDNVQKERRRGILSKMAAGGGSDDAFGYGKAWGQLINAGFDPEKALDDALKDSAVKKGYDDARMKIDADATLSDAMRTEQRDQLKHRTIMTQAFKDAGIAGAQAADIGEIRSGDYYEATMRQNVKREAQQQAPAQPQAPAAEPLKPKKDDEVGASLGGYALPLLRPRRRS